MIVLLDLDGVLADFQGAALRAHKYWIAEGALYGAAHEAIALSRAADGVPGRRSWASGRYWMHDVLGMEHAGFIAPCDDRFWAGLHPTPDGREIRAAVEGMAGPEEVRLLTCAVTAHASGKLAWIKNNLGAYYRDRRFFLGCRKEDFAGVPGAVLVDDHDANVDLFRAQGGRAVLVPRHWNVRWRESDRAAEAVRRDLAAAIAEIRNAP